MRTLLTLTICAAMAGCASAPYHDLQAPDRPEDVRGERLIRTWEVVKRPGADLFLQSWAPLRPPEFVVVIQHGLRGHGGRYRRWARRLVRRGAWVFALDMRGHGRSSGRRIWLEDFQTLVDDLHAVVTTVRERALGRPVFLYGHSIGGTVATLYAEQHGDQLAGLALTAPALQLPRPPIIASASHVMAAVSPAFPLLGSVCDDLTGAPEPVRKVCADPLIYKGAGPAVTVDALMEAIHDVWQHVDRIRTPVLAIHGTADALIDPRGTATLVTRLGDRAQLLLYPGAEHDVHRSKYGPRVLADVLDFIGRVLSTRSP